MEARWAATRVEPNRAREYAPEYAKTRGKRNNRVRVYEKNKKMKKRNDEKNDDRKHTKNTTR
jgi:hypothetical protein